MAIVLVGGEAHCFRYRQLPVIELWDDTQIADSLNRRPRVVCLTAESTELMFALGAGDQVVGVSSFAEHPPEVKKLPSVADYTTFNYDAIDQIQPDLVIGFSDLQADGAAELIRRGHNVLVTNQRSLQDVFNATRLIGRAIGESEQAERLTAYWTKTLRPPARLGEFRPPRVYFEEWRDPLICGIGWVSELIAAAGGEDVFAEQAQSPAAKDRIITSEMVVEAAPDYIFGSWCGKRFRPDLVKQRPEWRGVPAVMQNRVFAIEAADCLQPGPGLFSRGLPQLRAHIAQWCAASFTPSGGSR